MVKFGDLLVDANHAYTKIISDTPGMILVYQIFHGLIDVIHKLFFFLLPTISFMVITTRSLSHTQIVVEDHAFQQLHHY